MRVDIRPIDMDNSLIENLIKKLRIIHEYSFMTNDEKKDYDEEIDSIIPKKMNDSAIEKFLMFSKNLKSNIKYSIFEKKMFSLLGESWILFVFLNIINSFNKKSNHNKKDENFTIVGSYANSQFIFWKNVESLKNFFIIIKVDLNRILVTKISTITQISLKILVDVKAIEEKTNYVKTPKTFNDKEFYNKAVINYKLLISVETIKSFNVENKFYRSPLKITDYMEPVKGGKSFIEKSIISGPTYLRSDVYDKTNPFGIEPFKVKNKTLRNIYSETKFYPDISFIKHLKELFYGSLNGLDIEKKINIVKQEFEETFKETNWSEDIIKTRVYLQKKYSKLLEDQKISIFLSHNWEEYYHLSSNNDYRGRKYYCSPLTFTHFKMSRFCFHYGYEGEIAKPFFDWSENNKDINKIIKNSSVENIEGSEEIVGFYLIGMGKIDNERKTKIETPLNEILEKGSNIFLSEKNVIYDKISHSWEETSLKDKIDCIECECYRFGLSLFLKGDRTKRIILKDATASGYQIQTYLIGCDDEDKLKWVNIGKENTFVDTYLFIAESFDRSSSGGRIPNWAKGYFQRSIIKKFCMIIPYSAGFEECLSNIKEHLKDEDLKRASLLFFMFHEYIKKDLWKDMGLKKSFGEYIKEYIKSKSDGESNYTVESDTAWANLQYNKIQMKEYDTKYIDIWGNKKRTTRAYSSTKDEIDKRKTLTAFSPNFTHFHDSDIVRILHLDPYRIKFASVHDAFIVSSFECGKLVHSYGSIFKIKIRFKHKIPISCIM